MLRVSRGPDARVDHGLWPLFSRLLRPYRWPLAGAVSAMVLDAALTVLRPWPLKVVIDRVISHKSKGSHVPFIGQWLDSVTFDRMHILYGACAATLMIAISTGLLTYLYTRVLGVVAQKFVADLRGSLFAHMQRLSLRFHDRQRTGDLITRLTSDVQAIQDVLANGAIILFSNLFLLLGMMSMMLWLNWRFALAALSVSPLLFASVFLYTRRIQVASRAARTSTGLLASLAQETLVSIRIVQGLAQEDQQDERFQVQAASGQQAYLESVHYQARVAPMVDLLAAAGLAIVMYYGATRVMSGDLSTGDVIVFFAYVTNLYSPMKALSKLSYALGKAVVGAERVAEVMHQRSEVTDRENAVTARGFLGRIEFRDVEFEYEYGQSILSDINLTITPGETVAIVGATGAGKSTLVSLLPRFYDPTRGVVLLDARADEPGTAGFTALQRDGARKHRLRTPRCHGRRSSGSRGTGQCGRIHPASAARLRHIDCRARRDALRRAEAENRDCTGSPAQCTHPHPRRADQWIGCRIGATGDRGIGACGRQADHPGYRASSGLDPLC